MMVGTAGVVAFVGALSAPAPPSAGFRLRRSGVQASSANERVDRVSTGLFAALKSTFDELPVAECMTVQCASSGASSLQMGAPDKFLFKINNGITNGPGTFAHASLCMSPLLHVRGRTHSPSGLRPYLHVHACRYEKRFDGADGEDF